MEKQSINHISDKITIAVLDSGLDPNCQLGTSVDFDKSVGFFDIDDTVRLEHNIADNIGHGTAVTAILHRIAPNAIIIPIKIVNEEGCNVNVLLSALKYIDENISCNIINISLGITCCDKINELYAICNKLKNKGVIIVAAFDNQGLISYPAAFDCVIGVDANTMWSKARDYAAIINGEVNYVGFHIEHRVPWLKGSTQVVSGTSFLAPHFSGEIAKLLQGYILTFDQVNQILIEKSKMQICLKGIEIPRLPFSINKAIAFPFNKEMHSIVRFQSLLEFDYIEFYDVKYSGQVGRSISEWQWDKGLDGKIIQNIENVNWEDDFDTFILGHVSELERITGKHYADRIVDNCIKYNKKLYAFFDINDIVKSKDYRNLQYYFPRIESVDHMKISHKTHMIGVPILGVVGTSSRQGKYTVQLALRKALIEAGYRVGQLGTEPNALLFGMDSVYPMGYESTVSVKGDDAVYVVNRIMGHIQEKNPDIIIVGAQGNTLPLQPGGFNSYATSQHEFLLGCQADAYILCVNIEDDLDDIRIIIQYLQSLYSSKVLAIVLSPISRTLKWSIISSQKNRADELTLQSRRTLLMNNFDLPVYILNEYSDVYPLMHKCEEYFA